MRAAAFGPVFALAALAACATAPPLDPIEPPPPPPVGAVAPEAPQPAPVPPTAPERPATGDVVVVPAPERPAPIAPPDPRSVAERREDRAAWDRCVLKAQAREQGQTGANPVGTASPEEICAKALGMAGREAIPQSREP